MVYKEHGSSKRVHDQPCESLTERHARMTKTQGIRQLKGKTTNPNDKLRFFLIIDVPYQKPVFLVKVKLERKQHGKDERNMDLMYM